MNVDSMIEIPYSDFKEVIIKSIQEKWQRCRGDDPQNKIFAVQLKLGDWKSAFGKSRTARGHEVVESHYHLRSERTRHIKRVREIVLVLLNFKYRYLV